MSPQGRSASAERNGQVTPLAVVHIPHSATEIPAEIRPRLALSDAELRDELLAMTDRYTDELFALPDRVATLITFPVSRLVVDPERFVDDAQEMMATRGMGVVYTRTSRGRMLRRDLTAEERAQLLSRYYRPHHEHLSRAVSAALEAHGRCLVIDAHSFPSSPLPYEDDQRASRPEICLGTDPEHTPQWLRAAALRGIRAEGLQVEVDRPFAGAMVPADRYRSDLRVWSVMIEVRRDLYMDEATGDRTPSFPRLGAAIGRILRALVDEASARPAS